MPQVTGNGNVPDDNGREWVEDKRLCVGDPGGASVQLQWKDEGGTWHDEGTAISGGADASVVNRFPPGTPVRFAVTGFTANFYIHY